MNYNDFLSANKFLLAAGGTVYIMLYVCTCTVRKLAIMISVHVYLLKDVRDRKILHTQFI